MMFIGLAKQPWTCHDQLLECALKMCNEDLECVLAQSLVQKDLISIVLRLVSAFPSSFNFNLERQKVATQCFQY